MLLTHPDPTLLTAVNWHSHWNKRTDDLAKICPFTRIQHFPPRDWSVPTWKCIFQASQVDRKQGEFILFFNLLKTVHSHHESFPSPGDPGCDKHRECICALVLGSIFSYVIPGKLSVIKLCWPIPKVITAVTCSRWGVSPGLGITMSKKGSGGQSELRKCTWITNTVLLGKTRKMG